MSWPLSFYVMSGYLQCSRTCVIFMLSKSPIMCFLDTGGFVHFFLITCLQNILVGMVSFLEDYFCGLICGQFECLHTITCIQQSVAPCRVTASTVWFWIILLCALDVGDYAYNLLSPNYSRLQMVWVMDVLCFWTRVYRAAQHTLPGVATQEHCLWFLRI